MAAADKQKPEQLPLAFGHEAATGRDDLVVAGSVSAAASLIDHWPEWPSPVVIIVGPEGSGKSHLASVWQTLSDASIIQPVSGDGSVPDAEKGPVLLEDADRTEFDETTLFHVINAVREHGNNLLITARTWPTMWNVALPDLASRLKAATVVEIDPPNETLLLQVLYKLFADRQLFIDEKLANYIVSRMERSLSAAQSIVERLDSLALSRGVKVSRSLAAEVLNQESDR